MCQAPFSSRELASERGNLLQGALESLASPTGTGPSGASVPRAQPSSGWLRSVFIKSRRQLKELSYPSALGSFRMKNAAYSSGFITTITVRCGSPHRDSLRQQCQQQRVPLSNCHVPDSSVSLPRAAARYCVCFNPDTAETRVFPPSSEQRRSARLPVHPGGLWLERRMCVGVRTSVTGTFC